MATEAGSITEPPAAQTPLSAAPRRSCRARRVNSRFDNDEVDESFRQLVARIAAPDSHSILQSPQLAFHCPNPAPPPPPKLPAPPPVQHRADLTAPTSNTCKKGVNQNIAGSGGNKKKGAIVFKKSVTKKPCKDSEGANKKDKIKKSSQVQEKSVKKTKSTLLKSKKSTTFDCSSEDEVPLAKFASHSVTSLGLASDDDLPLAELAPKKETSESYSCGLPGNYSIKTIHNPDLSSTPISIVCIEDPDETRSTEVKKVKRKSFAKMFNLSKKSKLAFPHGHKKDNDSLSASADSKTAHKKSLDPKKSKHKMPLQPTQGKLLKIVNLKVVPNSLCNFSNNNPLRKCIENKTSSPTFPEKSEVDGLKIATLSEQSESIVSPSSILESENCTEKSSLNEIYGKYGVSKSSKLDSETEVCQVQNKHSDEVTYNTSLAVSNFSDSSRKATESIAHNILSGSGSLPKLSVNNKQDKSVLNLTFNDTKESCSDLQSNDCTSVSKGKRKLDNLGQDNYSLKSKTSLESNNSPKLNKDKLKSNTAFVEVNHKEMGTFEHVKSPCTAEKDPRTKITFPDVNNLSSQASSPSVPLMQDVPASHASKTLDKSSLTNSLSSHSLEISSSFGTPVVSTSKIKFNVSSSGKSAISFPLESPSKLTTSLAEDWSKTHSKTTSEKSSSKLKLEAPIRITSSPGSSDKSKLCSDQHNKFPSSSKNNLKSLRPSLSKSSVAKVELCDSIAEKGVCITGNDMKESRKSQDVDNQFHLKSNEKKSKIKDAVNKYESKTFNKESNKHCKRRTEDPTTSGNKKVKHEIEDSCSKTKSNSVKYSLGNVLLYSQSNHVTTNSTIKSERNKSDNKISKTNKADVSRFSEGDSAALSSVKHLKCEPYEEKPDIAMIRDTNEQLEVEVKNKGLFPAEKRLDDKHISLVKSEITHKEKCIDQHSDVQLSHEKCKVKSLASSPSAKKLSEVLHATKNLCEDKNDHRKTKHNHNLSLHSLSNLSEVKIDQEKTKDKLVTSPHNVKSSHGDKSAHDKKSKGHISLNVTNLPENPPDRNFNKNSDISKLIPTSELVDSKADIKPSLLITKIIEGTGDDRQYSLKSEDCLSVANETNTTSANSDTISTYNDILSTHKTVSQSSTHFHTSLKKEPQEVSENCRVSPTSDFKSVSSSTSARDESELVSAGRSRSREKGSSSSRHKENSHHKSSGKHKRSSKDRHRHSDSSSKSSSSSSSKSSSQKKLDSDCNKHEKVHSDEKHRRRDSSKSSHKDRDKNDRDKLGKSAVTKTNEKSSNQVDLPSSKLEEPTTSSVMNVYEPPAKEAIITSVKEDLFTTLINTSESSTSPTLSTILDENSKCISPVIELLNMCRANIPKNDPEVDKNVAENSLSVLFPAAVTVPHQENKGVALDSVEYKHPVTENKTQVSDHSLPPEEAMSTSLCLPVNDLSSVKCENDTDIQPHLESPDISINNREKSVKRSRETDSSDSDASNVSDDCNTKVSSKSRKRRSTSSPELALKSMQSKPIKRDVISDLPVELNDDEADSEKLFGEPSKNDELVTKVSDSIDVPLDPVPIDNLPESCPPLPADIKPSSLAVPESVSPAPVIETPEEQMVREVAEAEAAAEQERRNEAIVEQRMKAFEHLTENFYLIERKKSKQSKEVRRMVCDCTLTKEELLRGEKGCGDDCLNRLLMIECGWRCPLGTSCINRNFQRGLCAPVKVFNAAQKGCGVEATEEIPPGTFIMEYVGEVFDQREFRRRRKEYGRDGTAHFYFMALKADQFIDATRKGNISRFVNHSCDPNAETQKWTVNGELRVGFFSTKIIKPGEEINFDYRMERYGREPQKCYCGTAVCRGWLGEPPDEKTKEEKEEERRRASSTAPDRRKKEDKKQYDDELQDDLCELQRAGLRNRQDTLLLSRVMVRAESEHTRTQLLLLLRAAHTNTPCLRLFLDYHGLSLLWSWMADLDSALLHAPLKLQILKTLDILPITNRTQVTDSRVMEVVEKWSKQTPEPVPAVTAVAPSTDTPALVEASLEECSKKNSDTSEDSDDVVTDECSLDSMDTKGVSSKAQQQQSPDDNSSSSDSMSGAKASSKESPVSGGSGVLQQPSRETTPEQDPAASSSQEELRKIQLEVVSLAGELLARWQVLKEEFRIPKKQRVQLMREHERQVDADYRRYLDTERGRREMMERSYSGTRRDSYQDRYRSRMPMLDKDGRRCWQVPQLCDDAMLMNGDEFAGLSKEERREKFAQKVAIQDEQRRVQESMWSVHVERCVRCGLDPYLAPIVDPSGNYYWDAGNSAWVPLTPQTAFAAGVLNPALAQEQQAASLGYNSVAEMEAAYASPHDIPMANGEVIPPVVVTISLPPHWHIARDQHNRIYFYHSRSRQTQWDIPTLETKTTLQYETDSESDSESSSSSDSEEFSSDEGNGNEDEAASSAAGETADDEPETVEGKIIRRQRGKKKHSEALVQQRVISPIREMDRELARKERREAKERARHEARKERLLQQHSSAGAKEEDDDDEEKTDDLIVKVPHKPREKLKVKSKERAATAIADTSEKARKLKDLFRSRMATFIVSVLNPYRRADCRQGRINTTEDFKYLARKLTHFVMVKELKQLPSIESLDCNDSVKHKTKDFVRKYMAKYGSSFKRDPLDTKEY